MDARTHKILNTDSKQVDKIIQKKYSASFLNNTKWNKLINGLTYEFENIYINYKLIYDEKVEGYLFDNVDFEPFFLEPIRYKEVEWIEFPKEYEHWSNPNNLKAGKKIFTQDLISILDKIESIGLFQLEQEDKSIKIYAYR